MPEIFVVPIPHGSGFYSLDRAVDSFKNPIVNMGFEPAQNSIPMLFDCLGSFDDWLQSAMLCPTIPFLRNARPDQLKLSLCLFQPFLDA